MSPQSVSCSYGVAVMAEIKTISGWCIEALRKRHGITQRDLASRVGIAERWLREIEGGNPKSSFDDHIRCACAVGLTPSYLLIPLIFMARRMSFPRELLLDNLPEMETRCIATLASFSHERLGRQFQPSALPLA